MKNEDMAVELTSLKKITNDRWQFQVKSHSSFEAVFETLSKAHVFNASSVETLYSPHLKELSYFVNDQGIWLLSHCFSNWTEMYAKATQKSPWEEIWKKRTQYSWTFTYSNLFAAEDLNRLFESLRGEHFTQYTNSTYTHTFTPPVAQSVQQAFNLLGIPSNSTEEEVKKAFRQKAKQTHPDTGGNEAVFKALNAAYQLALAHTKKG